MGLRDGVKGAALGREMESRRCGFGLSTWKRQKTAIPEGVCGG